MTYINILCYWIILFKLTFYNYVISYSTLLIVDKLNATAFAPVKMDFQGNIRVSFNICLFFISREYVIILILKKNNNIPLNHLNV